MSKYDEVLSIYVSTIERRWEDGKITADQATKFMDKLSEWYRENARKEGRLL